MLCFNNKTLERVKNDLSGYCICGENDSGLFIPKLVDETGYYRA